MKTKSRIEYDRSLPFGFEELSSIRKDEYTIKDVSYLSPLGGKVPAYYVVPNGEGPFPAVIFMHPGQGNKTTFLYEAEDLASRGIISLLIDAPSNRNPLRQALSEEQQLALIMEEIVDVEKYIQIVVDLQRGIDLLVTLENVDANRLMYIGHSLGATWGGVLAGVEKRLKAYVLMAGLSSVSEWHKSSDHPFSTFIRHHLTRERFDQFISALEYLDAIHYIKNASPASLYFQFVQDDVFVSRNQAEGYSHAASLPKKIAWYETDHHFTNCDAAYQDRLQWIIRELK
ncbi:alpha/beta hydrolase family protein [Paenibacillus guangzhouensis]|uniref:alpha/beta hydrolase family protein n=1 Tax=Paenibacillus guangzhouensis TaxID=1473112 RepID=UPI0012669122|nr:acetylxylan esterase [Paenibacillus guangzhouensis]